MSKITNPIVPGWYADPEARTYGGRHYIYVTRSFTEYCRQMNLDCFSSDDLEHWVKHEGIIQMEDFPHIYQAVWAPTEIEHQGRHYLVFASNDIHSDEEPGGLEIAVSDRPEGPFRGYLGRPLVERFVHGAQPIDAHLFRDEDGSVYLYYGGWSHCNVAKMNEEMTGFIPFEDGEIFREITPPSYVEGPCMLKKEGKYFFMWSSGNWGDGSYRVSYAVSDSPVGGFSDPHVILSRQEGLAEGPGHHGYLYLPGSEEFLIVYHRRNIGDPEPGNRMLCIDRMNVREDSIEEVQMTREWVFQPEIR